MKHFNYFLILLLSVMLVGCSNTISNKDGKSFYNIPPTLLLYTNNISISYVPNIILWNDSISTSVYTFKDLINTVPISYIPINETINFNFLESTPDKIIISDLILNDTGTNMYSDKETIYSCLTLDNNIFKYALPENQASLFNSQSQENRFDIRGITAKVFWGTNECEYIFLIKTDPL